MWVIVCVLRFLVLTVFDCQAATVLCSLFATGVIVANCGFDLDRSLLFRRLEPSCFGMYPSGAAPSAGLRTAGVFVGEARQMHPTHATKTFPSPPLRLHSASRPR